MTWLIIHHSCHLNDENMVEVFTTMQVLALFCLVFNIFNAFHYLPLLLHFFLNLVVEWQKEKYFLAKVDKEAATGTPMIFNNDLHMGHREMYLKTANGFAGQLSIHNSNFLYTHDGVTCKTIDNYSTFSHLRERELCLCQDWSETRTSNMME